MHRVLRVHLQHEVELAAVPAVEPLRDPQALEDFRRDSLGDAASLTPLPEAAVISVTIDWPGPLGPGLRNRDGLASLAPTPSEFLAWPNPGVRSRVARLHRTLG